ncbi:putative polyketide synthase [Stachybotrys elegans]|uniref:Polyketide synthase n=1 Tax=Stachybotrys elegans TaxID=80388 RepID=A0A8K0SQM7_9HYPO|nr:putative polyketide synthase [Stachybotrys elegans]
MTDQESLAVVGYAYKAPGVGRNGLWEFLVDAKSAWSKVPADRFKHESFYSDKTGGGLIKVQGAHFLPDDIYAFDPAFFNLKADEARATDPQHRHLLECAYEAAESAGLTLPELMGARVGVFAAYDASEYSLQSYEDMSGVSQYTAVGTAPTMTANRLSYFFGTTGPSITVDAACAGSSYALHLACRSVLAGECEAAFVGGAKVLNGVGAWVTLDTMGALSAEGRSYSYDSKGAGFGRGEGSACVVIKRLSDALANRDPIRAVIRNTACNHSGRSNGITMPSRSEQENLLARVHSEAGLDPDETAFVEGHGTGTQVGDPIEAGAILTVVGKKRTEANPVHLGSIKSNFGHLEGASGIIALIKSIMMLEHDVMLPNAGFEKMNPEIEGRERLQVLTEAIPWPSTLKRRICISNFGFGGSNAAILVEQAPNTTTNGTNGHTNGHASATTPPHHLYVFSAKSRPSLEAYVSSFAQHLNNAPQSATYAKDLAYTLGQRRTHFPYRVAIAADSVESLQSQLLSSPPGNKSGVISEPNVAFVFTGQGAQYFQMGIALRCYPVFANAILDAQKRLSQLGATWLLTDELELGKQESRVNDAEISQPACTAIQLALVLLLRSWGVSPGAVVGHSSGEIAAAFAADLVTFDAAIAIAYFRGINAKKLINDETVQGGMSAGYATIAAINGPTNVTISGDELACEAIAAKAQQRNLFARKLNVQVAYHSQHMAQVADSYLASIQPLCHKPIDGGAATTRRPQFYSTVTGSLHSPDAVDASYWVKNLVQTVRFKDGLEALLRDQQSTASNLVIVEIGPHSALRSPSKQIIDLAAKGKGDGSAAAGQPSYLASLVREKTAISALLDLAGNLWSHGLSNIGLAQVNRTQDPCGSVLFDLPPYEFNKTVRYLSMSRITEQKLFGGHAPRPLLGLKSPYSEGDEYSFRNVSTLDDMPWARDHMVGGDVLFPLTGFTALASEAIKAVSPEPPASIHIREFHVKQSLRIEEGQRVDVTTKLRRAAMGTEMTSQTTWSVEVLSWSANDGWTSHVRGLVSADGQDSGLLSQSTQLDAALDALRDDSLPHIKAEDEYTRAQENGIHYGPAFRNMTDIWHAPGSDFVVHALRLPQLTFGDPREASPYTVDPATLDSMAQSVGLLQRTNGPRAVLVPSFVKRFRISNTIPTSPGTELRSVTRLTYHEKTSGTYHMDVIVFDMSGDQPKPIVEVEDLTLKSISGPSESQLSEAMAIPETYSVLHVPFVDLMKTNALIDSIKPKSTDPADLEFVRRLNIVGAYYLRRMINDTAGDKLLENLPHHLSKFLAWAKIAVDHYPTAELEGPDLVPIVSKNASGELVCKVGAALSDIVLDRKDGLQIMLEDGLLGRSYEDDVGNRTSNHILASYVQRLAECNPELRILEVGGGTGGASLPILEALQRATFGGPFLFQYTFTDISSGFFENAQIKLAAWSDSITYSRLDISQDPASQGFESGSYDLVLASNVLHATPDIVQTMRHVHSLLRPSGKVALVELGHTLTTPSVLPFAMLPGWWLAEDSHRSELDGPGLTPAEWALVLEESGFSGLDGHVFEFGDHPERLGATLWSTKPAPADKEVATSRVVVYRLSDDQDCHEAAGKIADSLGADSVEDFLDFEENENGEDDRLAIFVEGARSSLVSDLSWDQFEVLKDVLTKSCKRQLWVLPENAHLDATFIPGLLHTIRQEDMSNGFFLVHGVPLCSKNHEQNEAGLEAVTRLARHIQRLGSTLLSEQEYRFVNGTLHVPRICASQSAKDIFSMHAGLSVLQEQPIVQDDAAFTLTVGSAGSLDSIYFRRTDDLERPLEEEEVMVRVEAAGINFRDVLLILGLLPWMSPGFEGAGTVMRVGSGVSDVQPGDRVLYHLNRGGGIASVVRTSSSSVHKIPEGMSSTDAATLPLAYMTAFKSIVEIGQLQPGESILIHSAAGAVGQGCIRIAQHIGATVYVTAGTPEKREFLSSTFGIPADRIFSSRTSYFRDGIWRATKGQGVDVIVNYLAGELLQHTWELIAENGRFIELGKKDFLQNNYLPMRPFDRNVTFVGLDAGRAARANPELTRKCLETVVAMARDKTIAPVTPANVLPIGDLQRGLRALQSGQNFGKIVLHVGGSDKVLAERPPPAPLVLRPDATYVITGGTGGIGRAMAVRMASRGARNIVLLGRSGATNPKVAELLSRYEGTDICIRALACDVGSRPDLAKAIDSIQDMPPVRGVIHGALYLRDAFFINSTYDDWKRIRAPKVQAAWQIHEAYPELDFFVLLGSAMAVVGNAGQSIYTGTSSFLDALARYRSDQGQNTVSINLPVVEGVGYVAERGIADKVKRHLSASLTEAQLYTVIESAMIGPSSGLNFDGRAFSIMRQGKTGDGDGDLRPWEMLRALTGMRRKTTSSGDGRHNSTRGGGSRKRIDSAESLMEALREKVAAMIMVDRDEVTATRKLIDYGLDSLISSELHNWVKRETAVDLPLKSIPNAKDLNDLAGNILTRMTGVKK